VKSKKYLQTLLFESDILFSIETTSYCWQITQTQAHL